MEIFAVRVVAMIAAERTVRFRGFPPRDGQGRFVSLWEAADPKERRILVVDEFGNTGSSRRGETKFGFGVSEVRHPRAYTAISRMQRSIHRSDEVKAHSVSMAERTLVSIAVRATGTKTSCVYVDKNRDLPKGMAEKEPKRRIRGLLGHTLDCTLPNSGVILVVVDENTQYHGDRNVRAICAARSNDRRKVVGGLCNSKHRGAFSDLIQTNDFVTNAARSRVESGKKLRSQILGMRFECAGRNVVFKDSDMDNHPSEQNTGRTASGGRQSAVPDSGIDRTSHRGSAKHRTRFRN